MPALTKVMVTMDTAKYKK